MSVRATIIDGPLPPAPAPPPVGDETGALLVFEGLVRRSEDGRPLAALDYEAYEPMATRQLTELARLILSRHALLAIEVTHSRGRVPVGAPSLRVVITAAHRAEALAAMGEYIDLLKRDVPIWKKPVWSA